MADKHDFYLLPNWIHSHATRQESFPESLTKVVQELEVLIAETPKEGRAFLKPFFKLIDRPVASCKVLALNEHTDSEEFEEVIQVLKDGDKKAGFVSDAGLPIVADPGALLVKTLKAHHINIKAIPGPSSITHALLLSGFSGQAFAFHGYLPKLPDVMKKAIKELEYGCYENRMTQIFMERPYRNNVTFSILLETLSPGTLLCIAVELMGAKEKVITKTVEQWREKTLPDLHKKPTIFLIAAEKEDQKSMNKPRSHFIKEKRSFKGKRK